jgi:hypothetical protein
MSNTLNSERIFACYNDDMNTADFRLYRDRWKAVEEIERQELRALSMETRLKQMDSIRKLAKGLGLSMEHDESEGAVFARWADLKQRAK